MNCTCGHDADVSSPICVLSSPAGGDSEDHEDEEAHHECPASDGAGGDPQEHVPAIEEDDQGTDRVAH